MSKIISERDFVERRFQKRLDKIKADFLLNQQTCEHWNRTHPGETPLPIETWEEFLKSTGLFEKFNIKEA